MSQFQGTCQALKVHRIIKLTKKCEVWAPSRKCKNGNIQSKCFQKFTWEKKPSSNICNTNELQRIIMKGN